MKFTRACRVDYDVIKSIEIQRFKHESRIIPKEEIMANRCSKYQFINFNKE